MASGHGQGGMSLSLKIVRLLIVLFNLAFVVAGIILLAIGIYVVRDPKLQQLRPLLNPNLTSAYSQSFSYIEIFAIAIIVLGGALLCIGFLGKTIEFIFYFLFHFFQDAVEQSKVFDFSILSMLSSLVQLSLPKLHLLLSLLHIKINFEHNLLVHFDNRLQLIMLVLQQIITQM